jgi:hypothetical protein
MKRIAATFAVATIAGVLALATPALAYGGMDEEMRAELVALGLEEETIALFGEGQVEEIDAILAEGEDEEAKRARILALLPAHDDEQMAD